MDSIICIEEFLNKLSNYYEFEVGYDNSVLMNNLIKGGKYYDEELRFYNTTSYRNL